jgi:hypothetical protein
MPLSRQDALRLLHFCLGPDDSGSVDLADDGTALVTVAPADPGSIVRTFEATTFESALRQAVDAGLLKASCVEKQIAFLASGGPAARGGEPSGTPGAGIRRPHPDLFPRLVTATAALLHELQIERGMSSMFTASSGRMFKRELARQRERMDARRERWLSIRRELEGSMAAALARRLDRADARLRDLVVGRGSIDDGHTAPGAVLAVYSDMNAGLLEVADGALLASPPGENRTGALACVVLLYAKEKTGIERARVGASLAARASFSDEDRRVLSALSAARSSYLHVFSATAPKPAEQLLTRGLASTVSADFSRVEGLILSGRESELDVDARGWFAIASRQMDLLGEVGGVALNLVGG